MCSSWQQDKVRNKKEYQHLLKTDIKQKKKYIDMLEKEYHLWANPFVDYNMFSAG